MSHHHHHHKKHYIDKRRENLAWFGIVIVLVILAFCGLAVWSDRSHPIAPELPTAPILVNPPLGPVQGEPQNVAPPDEPPGWNPTVGNLPPEIHRGHRGRHHWHHDRRHHVASNVRMRWCLPPTISGYVGDDVTEIPNPDCN